MRTPPRVLLVEDDHDVRGLSEQILVSAGYDVVGASSGADALALLGAMEPAPDVVVLDIQMPDIDGWTLLDRIRSDPATATTRVLVCTVKTVDEDEVHVHQLVPDGHLTKPFTIDALTDAVARLADRAGQPPGAHLRGRSRP